MRRTDWPSGIRQNLPFFRICVLNGTPNGRYALPAMVYNTPAWPVQPIICEEDRNGAGMQELQLGFGPGRYDNQFLIPSAIPIHAYLCPSFKAEGEAPT